MAKKPDPISTGGQGDYDPADDDNIASHDVATIGAQDGDIMVPVKQGARRMHKATYAKDKKNGGYLVRVIGPNANAFVGKIVPVVKRDDSESDEALESLVWTGVDTGTTENPGTGKPVALYTMRKKPKTERDVEF